MSIEQVRFIDRLYKDLYLDNTVIRYGSGNKYDKFANIKAYLEKVEDIFNKISDTERHMEWLRKLYYDEYIIKPENIPESYYARQQEIALERGYGHIEITPDIKRQYQEQIINDQKASFDLWFDYFFSDDAKVYPFWAKYWAFQGMLKMGSYDKKTGSFGKRTEDTLAPFPDLNREAIAMSIDVVVRVLNNEEIDDEKLESLVRNGSFPKIYSYILTNILSDNKNITKRNEGIWVKYNQGSNHMSLVNSLQGYNTGWCTAGEETAKSQLSMGDFYVYYTLDENGEYKIPRVAIRMEYGEIAEIRGISEQQNIESEMESVVEEKLKAFPDREKYHKKVNDMKRLTIIYKKYKKKEELTVEELAFLYEIGYEIDGFGYSKDPRIEEIKKERNPVVDLNKVFKVVKKIDGDLNLSWLTSAEGLVLPENIGGSLNLSGLQSAEGLVLPRSVGDRLDLGGLTSAEGLIFPESIGGSLNLRGLTSSECLALPESIGGTLNLSGLTSAEGLVLPQSVSGGLDLRGLTSSECLALPESIGGTLNLSGLTSAEGLVLPQNMDGSLNLSGLTSAEGLVLPQSVSGGLDLNGLTSAEGLVFPESIGGGLYLSSLISAEGLVLPEIIGESLDLNGLTSAEGLVFPESIGESLYLNGLTSAEGLVLPQFIDGFLHLGCLQSAEGLVLPQSVSGGLDLNGLTSAEGLVFPESIGGGLYLSSLTSTEGLILPKSIGGTLYLGCLKSAEGLVLPRIVGGRLELGGLISSEGLVLPESIGGTLYLSSLTSAEGLVFPEELTYKIYIDGFKITPENVHEYRNSSKKK